MVNDIAVQEFVNAIKEEPTDTNTTYSATVSRIDNEGVVWVNIYGSEKETPTASTSTEVKRGDAVTVNWRNNRLYIGGNYSNPSAGIARVEKNEMATEFAIASAQTAQQAADVAVSEAERARIAADEAEQHASEAETQAGIATGYANDALTQLSVVEEVVDTLNWISEHGTYKKTADTTVAENKMYFTLTGTAVSPITLGDGTKLSNLESYYEKVNNVYVKTTDTTYNSSKTYYTVTAELVTSPTGNPSTSGYYEIDSIDTAVQNYISSHLALTDSGLYVVKDNSGYKVLLANDGLKVYDNQGHLVSTFGESIVFDSSRPQTIGNQSTYIKWYDSNNDHVADSIEIAGTNVNIASNVTIGGMPTKVSDLTNDSGYQTANDVSGTIVSTTTLYYASNSTTPPSKPSAHVTTNSTSTRGAWNIALPTYSDSYPYLYVCTETKTKGGTYAWTSVEQTTYASAISSIKSTAEAAQSAANGAVASTVSCYYRSTTESPPSISASTSIGTSANTDNAWEYVMPQPKHGCYFYTCEEYTPVSGTKTYSTVRPLDNATYTSKWCSSADNVYIDGGAIYANSVTADKMAANSITIGNMDSNAQNTIANAANTANSYLSVIDGTTGISVHNASDTNNFVNVNSSGMKVYKGGNSDNNVVASFGDTARIGKLNTAYVNVDDDSVDIHAVVNGNDVRGVSLAGGATQYITYGEVDFVPDNIVGNGSCRVSGSYAPLYMEDDEVVVDDVALHMNVTNESVSAYIDLKAQYSTDPDVDSYASVNIEPSLSINDTPMVDFVTAQGTSDIWTYRKWNSGIAECWGAQAVPSTTYAANGGYKAISATLPSGLFATTPDVVLASGKIDGLIQTSMGFTSPNNASTIQTYLINRAGSSTTQAGKVYWHVKGRWK